MSQSPNKSSFYSIGINVGQGAKTLLRIGLLYLGVGASLVLIPPVFKLDNNSNWAALLSNLGISSIAAGVVTLTIDWKSRQQSDRDTSASIQAIENVANRKISEIANVSEDAMLSLLTRDKTIFEQIREYVVRQEFMIRKYYADINLYWTNNEKSFLYQESSIIYDIENFSNEEKEYQMCFALENRMLGVTDEIHEITECKFWYINSDFENDCLTEELKAKLEEQKKAKQRFLEITETVKVQPGCSTRIKVSFKTTLREIYSQPWVLSRIADGMEITVNHPDGLFVDASALHPVARYTEEARKKAYTTPNDIRLKRGKGKTWKINTGILPFQGMHLHWKKI